MIGGRQVGQMFKIDGETVIGRSTDAAIQITDDGISRQHLRITEDEQGRVVLTDLGSRNGTSVNGERVSTRMLEDGDKIQIGSTTILKFSFADRLEEHYQRKLYEAAVRDPLTQVYNRRFLLERLETEVRYVERHGTGLALVLFDLDHFKRINDQHGHAVGDGVLVGFAENITRTIRNEDLAVRYGGEEFLVLYRGLASEAARIAAERIREQTCLARFAAELPELSVTVSAGVASLPHARITGPEQLLRAADEALYAAKSGGRNRVCLYDPG